MQFNILIVDDSKFDIIVLMDMIEKLGHIVIGEAKDGKEAINKYFKLLPDVVFMNLLMPVMNGIEAMNFILENDPEANIIVTSSFSEKEYVKEAILNGAKDFLAIPIKKEKLKEVLEKLK
ncbi:two-component system, chemotaxis family, response regulator CheY [Marinitoga hydrogenitolerans DSM 16785]|uniref:Two-component system, chemotaxis family, response regulator CheY n=1 Tax=Marinitoga hydrogenitolerans (strain DSM 16785 / JCM 12826 / AT1271) TaxID=1122195 RepID=A0A1M4S660_MARH1|nr:response regulator [Marinitoga hydrogenitolerans]SHE27507.1 two-component system, chemotaxis family, response regulator CheY [Marinitoga hydrogenitolerans DSM 16785]